MVAGRRGVLALSVAYLAAPWWIDRKNGAFSRLLDQGALLAASLPIVFTTYAHSLRAAVVAIQTARQYRGLGGGFASYLAGFALTATPGKTGNC